MPLSIVIGFLKVLEVPLAMLFAVSRPPPPPNRDSKSSRPAIHSGHNVS